MNNITEDIPTLKVNLFLASGKTYQGKITNIHSRTCVDITYTNDNGETLTALKVDNIIHGISKDFWTWDIGQGGL